MAATNVYDNPERLSHFHYFNSYGANGAETMSINPDGEQWYFKEVRVHLSVVHAEVVDLTVRVSAAQGSAWNLMLVSQAMSDVQDFLFIPDTGDKYGMLFQSDDQLVINLSLVSATNIIGVELLGWATVG